MRLLLSYLIAVNLLLSMTAAACAQAGRYIPIPVRPPTEVPFSPHFGPHLPWHFGGDSDFWQYVGAALAIAGAAWLGWAVGQALAEKRAPGSAKRANGVPAPDLVHEAWKAVPKAEATRRLMEFLTHRDRLFEPTALRFLAEHTFLAVQDAWQKGDYGPLGDLLLPPIRAEGSITAVGWIPGSYLGAWWNSSATRA